MKAIAKINTNEVHTIVGVDVDELLSKSFNLGYRAGARKQEIIFYCIEVVEENKEEEDGNIKDNSSIREGDARNGQV